MLLHRREPLCVPPHMAPPPPTAAAAGALLPDEFRAAVAQRLCGYEQLHLPGELVRANPAPSQVAEHLDGLLLRDPAVFLERHGALLCGHELTAFEPLRGDAEVAHYLSQLVPCSSSGAGAGSGGAADGLAARAKAAKAARARISNRRLAQLQVLERGGEYFSEAAMRAREPLLWHEHIGRYEGHPPPPKVPPPRPGGLCGAAGAGAARFADSLLAAHDEAMLRTRLDAQLAERDAAESEHDSSSHDEAPSDGGRWAGSKHYSRRGETSSAPGGPHSAREAGAGAADDARASDERRDAFLQEMRRRFVDGQDAAHVDYSAIDADASLDEAWAVQEARDAEDAYFACD